MKYVFVNSVSLIRILLDIDNSVLLNFCFQEEMTQISHSELTDMQLIGQGGFGKVYKARHARIGTVVYKELNTEKLGDRYAKTMTA